MSENRDIRPAIQPQLFWRMLVAGNITTLGVLLFVASRVMPVGIDPMVSTWLFFGGIVAVVPALLHRRYLARKEAQRGSSEIGENVRQVEQLRQIVTGLGLAQLPGLLGISYYFFSRDWNGTMLLLIFSAILVWKSRVAR